MKEHNGLRPHDVVVLLKIICYGQKQWLNKDLAHELMLSNSEISESLNRSMIAKLVDESKKKVFKKAFLEFLIHGLKYVFPQQPGPITVGLPTAHSAEPLKSVIRSEQIFVWADSNGNMRGQSIEPLYKGQIFAAKRDQVLYHGLSLIDAIRLGKAREKELAVDFLTALINAT